MRSFALPVITLASLVVGADAACSTPPKGAIIVDRTGGHSGYHTIGEAVEKLDGSMEDKQTVFIYPGIYAERVVISKLKGPLVLQGYTCDTMSYSANQVTITNKRSQKDVPPHDKGDSNDLASTLSINVDNVQVYNLNLVNTAVQTPEKGQAPALSVVCKKCAFYACNITGHQDTLYANKGTQLYTRSFIAGTVDYIFGSARAYFQLCDIESVGPGYITANGRANKDNPSYFVLNKARVFGSQLTEKVYLGRPWKVFARAVFQECDLSDIINPLGWKLMREDMNTSNFFLKEYQNTGPGSDTKDRVSFSGQLDDPIDIKTILGDDYETFVDTCYL